MGGKKPGHVSPAKGARMLGIHQNTAYAWARDSAEGRSSRLREVQRHPLTGYLHIPLSEINRIKDGEGS